MVNLFLNFKGSWRKELRPHLLVWEGALKRCEGNVNHGPPLTRPAVTVVRKVTIADNVLIAANPELVCGPMMKLRMILQLSLLPRLVPFRGYEHVPLTALRHLFEVVVPPILFKTNPLTPIGLVCSWVLFVTVVPNSEGGKCVLY